MNPDIPGLVPALALVMLLAVAGAGCMEASDDPTKEIPAPASAADDLYARAEAEMADSNYRAASSLYEEAYELYTDSDDAANALLARNGMVRATWATAEYPYNRTAAEAVMEEMIPTLTEDTMTTWLDRRAQTITSDGETLYFENIAQDYLYAHVDELRPMADSMIDFGYLSRYAVQTDDASAGESTTLPYVNPVRYAGTETLALPGDVLPEAGTIAIWYPLPLETASQRDIVVTNLSHKEYIVTGPVTEGGIAYVYYEVPADEIEGDLTISADIAFTSYEQRFTVDPAIVGAYDTTDPEYILSTSSGRNIAVTDEIRDLAQTIVGNETNPYLQAQALYWYIIDTYPYSHAPHLSLDTVVPNVPESSYMFATGHGDCGTQSQFFAALCRSLGIPARATGGYQMLITGQPSPHFWAQYYIEGYGWIPCDKTVAEIADWVDVAEEDRKNFKTYYANNLDPARLVIQKDVDAPMNPPIPADAVVFRAVLQSPAIVCDTAEGDLNLLAGEHFTIHVEGKE